MKRLLPFLFLFAAAVASADRAVIVGVNEYVQDQPRPLGGPVNDANDMAAFFRKQGYTIGPDDLLLNEKATKTNIAAALKRVKDSIGADERFLFYFAGHGMNRGKGGSGKDDCYILPHDFAEGAYGNAIGVEELYGWIKAIPSRSNRTVVLDTCFSGGMARDGKFFSRGYSPFNYRTVPMPPRGDRKQAHLAVPADETKDKICYLTASQANEQALEADVEDPKTGKDTRHGLFTHYLLEQLQKEADAQTYGQVSAGALTEIAKFLEENGSSRKQTPDVTDQFRNLVAFKAVPAPPPAGEPAAPLVFTPPKRVWDMIAQDRSDPSKLQLSIANGRTDLLVGQTARFEAKVGTKGYLVVVRSQKNMQIVWPPVGPDGKREFRPVEPGTLAVTGPKGETDWFFQAEGGNRLTAFLFESEARARQLVDSITTRAKTIEQLESEEVVPVANDSPELWNSALSFEIGNELPGGYRIAKPFELFAAIDKNPYRDGLFSRLPAGLTGYLDALDEAKPGQTDEAKFGRCLALVLNAALGGTAASPQELLLDPNDTAGLPAEAAAAIKDAAAKLKAGGEDPRVVHARLLATLFPQAVVADTK